MASLLDIVNLTETVKVRGVDLEVSGVSAGDLFRLITRFPEFKEMIGGNSSGITPEKLVSLGSDVAATIIAMVTGSSGNLQAEAKAKQLSAGEQVEIVSVGFKLTFPRGIGPFVDQLTSLAASISPEKTQIESSSILQERSVASLNSDTDLSLRGRLPLVQ